MSTTEKALYLLRNLPRISIHNIKDYPEYETIRRKQVIITTVRSVF